MLAQMMAMRDPQLVAYVNMASAQLRTFGGVSGPVALGLAQLIGRDFNIPVTQAGLINVAHTLNNPMFRNRFTGVRGDINGDGCLGLVDVGQALFRGAMTGIPLA